MILFSPSQTAFYDSMIHVEWPEDAQEIGADLHAALLSGQGTGQTIAADELGRPVLTRPAEPSAEELLLAERARMVCTRFQLRAALHAAGLLEAAGAAVAAADPMAQIGWADGANFRRDSATVSVIARALELSDVALDQIFRAGAVMQP